MKNINKILAVSVIAMLAVPAAQAKIVSETMLSSEAGHYSGTHTVQSEIDTKLTANEAITAGTGTKITYDAKGLVTGSANLSASDIPTLATSKISGLDAALSGKEVTSNKSTSANAVADSTGSNKDTKYPTVAGAKAIAEAAVSGASGNYVPTSRTVNSKALSDNITLDGSDVKVKTGYAKKTGNVAAGDTIDAAIGKLETKADSAASAAASAASAAAAAQTTADGKVTANADITASGNSYKIVQYDKKGLVTAGKSLAASDIPALPESKITNLTTDLAAKQTTENMEANTTSYNVESTTKYPSMAVAQAMIEASADNLSDEISGLNSNKQDKLVSSGTGANVVSSGSGNVVTEISAADGVVTVTKGSTAVLTSRKVNGKALSSDVTLGAADIKATSYTKGTSSEAIAATDTLNQALSKLENKADNAATAAADAATAAANAKNSVTATGSNGVTASASNGAITVSGTAATSDAFGVVKTGTNITNSSGTISVATASTTAKGVMQVGSDLTVSSGKVSVDKATTVASGNTKPVTSGAVYTAVSAKQDKLGGTAGKLVVTTATAGTVAYTDAVPTSILATPSKDGVFVLTAKNDNGTTTFYWEDIGR